MVVSSFNDLTVLSIHPKQRASSTASLYKIRFLPVFFNGYSNQISSNVSKFVSSHFLHSFLSMKYLVAIFVHSINCFWRLCIVIVLIPQNWRGKNNCYIFLLSCLLWSYVLPVAPARPSIQCNRLWYHRHRRCIPCLNLPGA